MTAEDLTLDLFDLFNPRQNIMVPNVSWGLFIHREVDLLKVTASGYAHEYEIKVSLADLKRDGIKRRDRRQCELIRSKTYVMPAAMEKHVDLIPVECGYILMAPRQEGRASHATRRVHARREAETNKCCRKLTDREIAKVARLGALRIPGLMRKVRSLRRSIQHERSLEAT